MSGFPRDPALDSTLAILKDGYDFIWNRCRHLHSDAFVTRMMGMKTICIHGSEAARLFYDESKLQRKLALPRRVVTSLFGKGAIHTLDDEAHRHRKAAFLSLMTPVQLERLMELTAEQWREAIERWSTQERVVLFDEVPTLLLRSVCAWSGVPLAPGEAAGRAADLVAMVDAFGGVGPRLWKGKLARSRAERWIAAIIEQVRGDKLTPPAHSALSVMAHHRELDGKLLSPRVAAVELLNVIRPTVAISWYIAFAALALHQHPDAELRLAAEAWDHGGGEYADLFMQEVRRFYPFTPFLGAMVRDAFDWRGQHFGKGTLVLLDVHGTNHDPAIWGDPQHFRPERFRDWDGSAYNFIPQGGGPRETGHRCPGEWVTMHNVTLALHFLTRCMTYKVASGQDLSIDLSRMPTRPQSGFVLLDVQATETLNAPAPALPSIAAQVQCFAANQARVTTSSPRSCPVHAVN